jgi:hypothetical protein
MNTIIRPLLASLCLLVAMKVSAQSGLDIDPDARTVRPGAEAAQVSGVLGRPGRELFGVRFVGLNGRNIPPRDTLWLAPGSYLLTTVVDASHVRRPPHWGRSRPRNSIAEQEQFDERLNMGETPEMVLPDNQILVELEAGKTYEIRARYNDADPDSPYTLVVHRIIER